MKNFFIKYFEWILVLTLLLSGLILFIYENYCWLTSRSGFGSAEAFWTASSVVTLPLVVIAPFVFTLWKDNKKESDRRNKLIQSLKAELKLNYSLVFTDEPERNIETSAIEILKTNIDFIVNFSLYKNLIKDIYKESEYFEDKIDQQIRIKESGLLMRTSDTLHRTINNNILSAANSDLTSYHLQKCIKYIEFIKDFVPYKFSSNLDFISNKEDNGNIESKKVYLIKNYNENIKIFESGIDKMVDQLFGD